LFARKGGKGTTANSNKGTQNERGAVICLQSVKAFSPDPLEGKIAEILGSRGERKAQAAKSKRNKRGIRGAGACQFDERRKCDCRWCSSSCGERGGEDERLDPKDGDGKREGGGCQRMLEKDGHRGSCYLFSKKEKKI